MKNTLSHTVWECKYHVVWVPKKRRRVIYGKLRQEIVGILKRLCEYKRIEIIEGKACLDYIHLCLSIPSKYSVAGMIGYLKGKSSMIIFERFSKLKKNFKGHHFWARGYYVSTADTRQALDLMEAHFGKKGQPTTAILLQGQKRG